jgi:hypothetical protein
MAKVMENFIQQNFDPNFFRQFSTVLERYRNKAPFKASPTCIGKGFPLQILPERSHME